MGRIWACSPMQSLVVRRWTCGHKTQRMRSGSLGGNGRRSATPSRARKYGFGGPDGIPNCTRLDKSEKNVVWKMVEDAITVPASSADRWADQGQVARQSDHSQRGYILCDLWAELKEHNVHYMAHHAIAMTWRRHCHERCLEPCQGGLLVVETDVAEKYTQPYIPSRVVMVDFGR